MTVTPSRLLLPFSWLYGALVMVRNLFFDMRIAPTTTMPVPVISVGNLSTGGTGKTPFVAELASLLQKLGKKPLVLSRGYGRSSKGFRVVSNGRQKCAEALEAGDEPALLAENLKGVPVVVDEVRSRGARKGMEFFAPDVIVLDDGFQHRALSRDCDIVLLSAAELSSPSFLLPAGYRREPMSSLRRAHVIAVSKCSDLDEFNRVSEPLRTRFHAPIIGLRTAIETIRAAGTGTKTLRHLRGKKTVAFSGIADSSSFDRTLQELGADIVDHQRFKDHHWYTPEDFKRIGASFRNLGADVLVTTEKDMIRIGDRSGLLTDLPLYVVEVRSEIIAGKERLQRILETIMTEKKRGGSLQ